MKENVCVLLYQKFAMGSLSCKTRMNAVVLCGGELKTVISVMYL